MKVEYIKSLFLAWTLVSGEASGRGTWEVLSDFILLQSGDQSDTRHIFPIFLSQITSKKTLIARCKVHPIF